MIALYERLISGDVRVVSDFQQAVEFWRERCRGWGDLREQDLANEIANAQIPFEFELKGNRYFAKSIMPTSMLAALYDDQDGFGDNESFARKLVRATRSSMVSIEVKGTALRLAALAYGLEDELT